LQCIANNHSIECTEPHRKSLMFCMAKKSRSALTHCSSRLKRRIRALLDTSIPAGQSERHPSLKHSTPLPGGCTPRWTCLEGESPSGGSWCLDLQDPEDAEIYKDPAASAARERNRCRRQDESATIPAHWAFYMILLATAPSPG